MARASRTLPRLVDQGLGVDHLCQYMAWLAVTCLCIRPGHTLRWVSHPSGVRGGETLESDILRSVYQGVTCRSTGWRKVVCLRQPVLPRFNVLQATAPMADQLHARNSFHLSNYCFLVASCCSYVSTAKPATAHSTSAA